MLWVCGWSEVLLFAMNVGVGMLGCYLGLVWWTRKWRESMGNNLLSIQNSCVISISLSILINKTMKSSLGACWRFSERQTLNKNRGGALWSGADGPRFGAGRSATWRRARVLCLTAGRSAPWGPDGPRVRRGGGSRRRRPGSRSRKGPRRGGEILGDV
jgi:hypothetical protein